MKQVLAGLLCALLIGFANGQDQQPDAARGAGQGRGRPTVRQEPFGSGREIKLNVLIADMSDAALESSTPAKILEMEKEGRLAATTRLELLTLDELPGFIQVGGRTASRTATTGGRGGPPATNSAFGFQQAAPSTAVVLQATPRIDDDGSILMQIYLDRPLEAVPQKFFASDATDETRRSVAFSWQSTVRLKSGEAKLVGSRQFGAGTDRSQTWILVTATAGPEVPRAKANP